MKRLVQVSNVVLAVLVSLGLAFSSPAQKLSFPGEKSEPTVNVLLPRPEVGPPRVPNIPGTLFIPKSGDVQPIPTGHYFAAKTNVQIYLPSNVSPTELPPFPGYGFQTPASLGCHYGFFSAAQAPNCNPNTTTGSPSGGSQSIAIVDAYDDPAAPGDLAWFSLQFGIPLTLGQFQVVWANTSNSTCNFFGVPNDISGGWELEEALDIEWAHAMAPGANLYLVEACSNLDVDLQQAVLVANNLVQCGQSGIGPGLVLGTCPAGSTGKGEVSMSWGGGEFAGETASNGCATLNDSCFATPNVVYFAASGDHPGVIWPGTSPSVVSAGGTSVRSGINTSTNSPNFNFQQESAWDRTGGGASFFEPKPSYQAGLFRNPTPFRGVPDLSFDADPFTGVYVYDTFPIQGFFYYQWVIVGGTSVSAPALAGIINNAGSFAASTNAELTTIYANRPTSSNPNPPGYTAITSGFCGPYMSLSVLSAPGWNFCAGVGVPNGYANK